MATESHKHPSMPRRKFLSLSAATMGALGTLGAAPAAESGHSSGQHHPGPRPTRASIRRGRRAYNSEYAGEYLNQVAFPLGGLGAGMICLEGTGALSHVSLRNHPDVFNEPCVFAAISVKGKRPAARVLEGPVPGRKLFGASGTGNGAGGTTYGLPRFANATFRTRFPFGVVTLADPQVPLSVEITGWSPSSRATLTIPACPSRRWNTGSPTEAKARSRRCSPSMPRTSWRPKAIRKPCGPSRAGSSCGAATRSYNPSDEAAFSATVSEPGRESESCLVPGRLVGRVDHGLEGCGRGSVL